MIRLVYALALACLSVDAQEPRGPAESVEALLKVDREFAAAAANRRVSDALASMFAPGVSMQTRRGFVTGRDSVLAELRGDPHDAIGRLTWTPLRGGIAADGRHGFTFGYLTLTRPDTSPAPMKYMAWWVRGPEGWRIAVYNQSASPAPAPRGPMMPPSLPAQWGVPLVNAGTASADIAAAESAFSDLASRVGLSEAFRATGAADAVNMGGRGSASFVVGPDAIAIAVGQGETPGTGSAVRWASDRVLVASSGDLGVSIGTITVPASERGAPPARIPFFTIWRRDGPAAPWRYVAE